MMKKLINKVLIFGVIICGVANATQNITIVGKNGGLAKPKLAIVKFTNDSNNLSGVVLSDMNYAAEYDTSLYLNNADVKSANYILKASIQGNKLNYSLLDAASKAKVLDSSLLINRDPRYTAHQLSNDIYHKLSNSNGVFTSKIAYIVRELDKKFALYVADYDGYNPKKIIASPRILSSIAWSQDGSKIAYVSYERYRPEVFVQNINTGKRYLLSGFKGSNSSPAWINSNKMLVTLSLDDGSHLYLLDNKPFSAATRTKRLISYGSIDTEADVSVDGKVIFTSDYAGGPQIYMTNLTGASPTRVTTAQGNYNTTARFSNNGKLITFISSDQNSNLKTFVMNLSNGLSYPVTQGTNRDLAPTFSPNDKLILFSSNNQMYITTSDGSSQKMLPKLQVQRLVDQSWSHSYNLEKGA